MAIKIDIPNIGTVEVENAAQEDTLKAILAAISKSDKTKRAEEEALKKAKAAEAKAAKELAQDLDDVGKEADDAAKKQRVGSKSIEESYKATKESFKGVSVDIANFGVSLMATATRIGVDMIKNMDANVADPIGFGANLISTGIDAMAAGLKIATTAVGALASGILGAIPIIGGGLSALSEGLTEAAKQVIDLAAQLMKTANEFMAAEFKKTVESVKGMTAAGASFAGGMTEMRRIANESGVGLTTLTNIVKNSSSQLREFGFSSTESVKLVSDGMSTLAKTGKTVNGQFVSTRDQLVNLGYSYEEQGEIMAGFMAQQRQAGVNLAKMTPKELTDGVAQYAKDLKVLADITGKDAKKAQEEAQKATMFGDIISKLKNPEEIAKFQAAYRSMPDALKKGFLEKMSGGVVADEATNILMAQNEKVGAIIENSVANVYDASKTASQVQKQTLGDSIAAGKAQRELNDATSVAARFGASNLQTYADTVAQLNTLGLKDLDQVEKSANAADKQMMTQDDLSKSYAGAVKATNDFQVSMEQLATTYLPAYGTMIQDTITKVSEAVQKGIEYIKDPSKIKEDVTTAVTGKTKEDREREAAMKKEYQKKYGGWGDYFFNQDKGQFEAKKKHEKELARIREEEGEEAYQKQLKRDENLARFSVFSSAPKGKSLYEQQMEGATPGATVATPQTGAPAAGPGKAKGGIASGPLSGYQEILHGMEAVVPLPDNKTIPVSLDSSSLTAAINQNNAILHDILKSMQQNVKYTSGILQNSY